MKPNPVVWFEIYVQDMARARKFYEAVFQCTLELLAAPEGLIDEPEILAFPMDQNESGASGILLRMDALTSGVGGIRIYFACEDCAQEQSRVEAAGGKIHQPKFAIGQYGFCAVIADTEGNHIGLHSMK